MDAKPHWISRVPPKWRSLAVKIGFHIHPAFRGHGGKLIFVSDDLMHIKLRLPLNWRTRNMMGSLYGGALFSVTDGIHMAILSFILGQDYIVWDKSAKIRFIKPGYSDLFADFIITPAELSEIRDAIAKNGEVTKDYIVNLVDKNGVVHTEVERTLYIADKAFFKAKKQKKNNK